MAALLYLRAAGAAPAAPDKGAALREASSRRGPAGQVDHYKFDGPFVDG
ncbi:hypothetical protein [Massilia sp. DWR3-1-1]